MVLVSVGYLETELADWVFLSLAHIVVVGRDRFVE